MQEHIVVVDDDADIRDILRTQLVRDGYRVSEAGNGAGLRSILEGGSVDLVILDLMLPDEDGLSLTRYLKAHGDTAIIILTG